MYRTGTRTPVGGHGLDDELLAERVCLGHDRSGLHVVEQDLDTVEHLSDGRQRLGGGGGGGSTVPHITHTYMHGQQKARIKVEVEAWRSADDGHRDCERDGTHTWKCLVAIVAV